MYQTACRNSGEPNGIKCKRPRCKYRGTFGRVYDLNRHMKKHTTEQQLRCLFVDCTCCFYRQDKLRKHLMSKKAHGNDDLARCAQPYCDATPMTLDLLKIHSIWHKRMGHVPDGILAKLWEERSCPLTLCDQSIKMSFLYSKDNMPDHIRTHFWTERRESQDAMRNSTYNPVTGDIICPICGATCQTTPRFAEHLDVEHLEGHLQAFIARLRIRFGYDGWESWDVIDKHRFANYGCSACGVDEAAARDRATREEIGRRHRALLQVDEGIRTHRRAILNLLPSFSFHPVFDDIRPAKELRQS
ncbi:hypothetical protein K491DRAFT_234755 [Lophiostoma macrostomum CBS 122681]|uniref:C2H2-type domain-containing protein n=1 Tax=Lophiostoma macrostomum CBS 122681 TaxID=1314788 RepID=A0A6A6TG33_9PLEO|nr:hypothetical protein K491DRAFT_234755 [Lophiostoma macrostomum CBS 122681]